MLTKNNEFLNVIDLKKKNLLNIKNFISNKKINLLVNVDKKKILKKFTNFSKIFGPALKYRNKPYYKFNEISQQQVGLHTDGVSCLVNKKIPKLLFFYVSMWPQNCAGRFKVVSIKKLLSKIPKKYLKILKTQDLQYLDYFPQHRKISKNQVSFQKKCLYKVNGNWSLNMFLPLKKDDPTLPWKYKMKFENLNIQNSKKILSKIRFLAEQNDCLTKIPLLSETIMIFDNEKFFHGREKFTKKIKRSLYRIQTLNKTI
jgi:hypothetical protein